MLKLKNIVKRLRKIVKDKKNSYTIKRKVIESKREFKTEESKKEYESIQSIQVGDMVRLSQYAKAKYERGKYLYGCCSDADVCLCEKMFERELIGLVTKIEDDIADVTWGNNVVAPVLVINIDKTI